MPFWHQESDVASLAECLQCDDHSVCQQAVYYIKQCVLKGPQRVELLRALSSCFQALDLLPSQFGGNSVIRNDSSLQEELCFTAGLALCLQYGRILSQTNRAAVTDARCVYKALESEAVLESLIRNPKLKDGMNRIRVHHNLIKSILRDMEKLTRGNGMFASLPGSQKVEQYVKRALKMPAVEQVTLVAWLWVQV